MTGEPQQLDLAPWIKRFPGEPGTATIVFPHAGGAAAAYRNFARALTAHGVDTFIMQYPQRGERL
uniref:thioesterase domain-containing protein n=1 Tax=uncultured Mycolicibacterium sp. TaxID=2320817 RepID=UPI0032B1D125